jgi:hypothetical protein
MPETYTLDFETARRSDHLHVHVPLQLPHEAGGAVKAHASARHDDLDVLRRRPVVEPVTIRPHCGLHHPHDSLKRRFLFSP